MAKCAQRLVLNFSVPLFKYEAKPSQEVSLSDCDYSLLWADNELLYRCYSGQLWAPGEIQPRTREKTHFKATTKRALWLANRLRTDVTALDVTRRDQQTWKDWTDQKLWSSKLWNPNCDPEKREKGEWGKVAEDSGRQKLIMVLPRARLSRPMLLCLVQESKNNAVGPPQGKTWRETAREQSPPEVSWGQGWIPAERKKPREGYRSLQGAGREQYL